MGMQKVEFTFPDDEDDSSSNEIEIEPSSALEMGDEGEPEPDPEAEPEPDPEPEPLAATGDELEIEIVDDTPAADRGRKKSDEPAELTDDELGQYNEKVQKRIKHFSKGYHDERREKETAMRERTEMETFARKLMQENETLKDGANKSQSTLLAHAKKTVTADLARAKTEYKSAYESGNADAVLEAQEKLTQSQLRADKLAQIKLPPLQDQKAPVQTETHTQQPAQPAPKPQVDARAKQWADDNTWFGSDDGMTGFALGYHNEIVNQGIDPTSDEYYEKVNSRMREVFPDQFDDTDTGATEQPRKKSTNVVASTTRSKAPKKVKLTKTQVSIAKKLGVPLESYAKQVAIEMRKNSNG